MPLTKKGKTILAALIEEYGDEEKAKEVLYAGENSGRFTGIHYDDDKSDKKNRREKSKKRRK